jgi:cellulose biosynthesis protein BcsQ
MAKKIALFNHKGGVSKTTTTFHLGWMLAAKGKKVLMVDTDPRKCQSRWDAPRRNPVDTGFRRYDGELPIWMPAFAV